MATFKVKYCHRIFDILGVRNYVMLCLIWLFKYGITCRKIAFDSDHVHMILDLGIYNKPELTKRLKGFVAKQMFMIHKIFLGKWFVESAYDIEVLMIWAFTRYRWQKYSSAGRGHYYLIGIEHHMLSSLRLVVMFNNLTKNEINKNIFILDCVCKSQGIKKNEKKFALRKRIIIN